MASDQVILKKNDSGGMLIYVSLADAANALSMKVNPTVALGDFMTSIDGAAFTNITTYAVTPAGSQMVKLTLTQAQINADTVIVRCVDQSASKEWADLIFTIDTSSLKAGEIATAAALTTIDSIVDSLLANLVTDLIAEPRDTTLIAQFKKVIYALESHRGTHTAQFGNFIFVDPVNGDTHANGNRGGQADPYLTLQDAHDNAVTDSNHDVIILLSGAAAGATTHTVAATTTFSKRYMFVRGPGRDFIITRTGSGDTIEITADGIEISGCQIGTAVTGTGVGVKVSTADFARIHDCWINDTQGDGIRLTTSENCQVHDNVFIGTGVGGSGHGLSVVGTAGTASRNHIMRNTFHACQGDGVKLNGGTINQTIIDGNTFEGNTGYGVNIGAASTDAFLTKNKYGGNSSGEVLDAGTTTYRTDDSERASETDLTDARSRLPAALASGRMVSDVTAINGNNDAAVRLALTASRMVPFTVDTVINGHTPTITEFQADDITETTTDHFKPRYVLFTSGALNEQIAEITGYAVVGGIGQFTVSAMTDAPANNDTGIII